MKHMFLLIFSARWSKVLTSLSFIFLFLGHLVILPAHQLGSDIGINSFASINVTILLFSLMLAASESVLITLWVMLIKQRRHCRTAPAAGGMLIGFVSPLLCCTPALPTLLSFVAIVFPSVGARYGMKIQYFVNVYQNELLIFAFTLIVFSIYQNMKHLKGDAVCQSS